MPCKCSGLRVDKCKCRLVRAGYPWRRNESDVVFVAHTDSFCSRRNIRAPSKPSMFLRILENLYDKCAGYNLRYCPFRGFVKNDNNISTTFKDLLTLACFLIANLVVLLTILTKTTVHMSYGLMQAVDWARSHFNPKMVEGPAAASKPLKHIYSPPLTYKFI